MSKWSRAFGQSSGGLWIENRADFVLNKFVVAILRNFTFLIQNTAKAQAQK